MASIYENPTKGKEEIIVRTDIIQLLTFKKSGKKVPTTIWYAEDNGKIFFITLANAGKVKRIENNENVEYRFCNEKGKPIGPSFSGKALKVNDHRISDIKCLLEDKYSMQFKFFLSLAQLLEEQYEFFEIVSK